MSFVKEILNDAGFEPPLDAAPAPRKSERISSTIQFPYTDMADAILVADGLLKGGGVPLSRDQMAAAMGLSPNGGGFATKVATARIFGVIDATAGKYQLSDLGFEIVDDSRQADAKVKAFLNVELFRRTYDEFRGKLLPPKPHGLERAFVNFGVSIKNVKAARLAFERSARLAGMFPNASEDRLVIPFGANTDAAPSTVAAPITASADIRTDDAAVSSSGTSRSGDGASSLGLHRSILGMLDELPPAKSEWDMEDQAAWLHALGGMFRVLYKSDGKGEIEVRFRPAA